MATVGKRKKKGPRKQKSGAQKRRERFERDEAAAAEVVERARELGIPVAGAVDDDEDGLGDDAWSKEFLEAGPIDLENPDTDLAYVRKLQLIVLRQMATTPHPSKAQQDAWRRIREMSAVVGMTSNRAKLEADLRSLKKQLAQYQEQSGALKVMKGSEVKRPPTARGRTRGPRALPPEEEPPTPKP